MNVYNKNPTVAKKIMHFLAEAGADLNAKNDDLWAPLHLGIRKNNYEAVEALLQLKNHPNNPILNIN